MVVQWGDWVPQEFGKRMVGALCWLDIKVYLNARITPSSKPAVTWLYSWDVALQAPPVPFNCSRNGWLCLLVPNSCQGLLSLCAA